MWILFERAPLPDLPYWPGRRWLAALDAVAWPTMLFALLLHVPRPKGLVLPVVGALCILAAWARFRRALWMNERYRFATWRWGKVAAGLLLVGIVLKVGLALR